MLFEMFSFVIEIVAGIFAGFLLLRFWMQALRIRPPGSLGQAIFQITDWLVKPIRRVVPGFLGLDWASLIAAFLVSFLSFMLESLFSAQFNIALILLLSVARLLQWIIYGLMALLVFEAILSFVNPYAPLAPVIRALNQPLLAPLRRVIPLVGNIDFSPLVALIVLQLLSRLLISLVPRLYIYVM